MLTNSSFPNCLVYYAIACQCFALGQCIELFYTPHSMVVLCFLNISTYALNEKTQTHAHTNETETPSQCVLFCGEKGTKTLFTNRKSVKRTVSRRESQNNTFKTFMVSFLKYHLYSRQLNFVIKN